MHRVSTWLTFNFYNKLNLPQNPRNFEAFLKRSGKRNRLAAKMGFKRNVFRFFISAAGCFPKLQDHFVKAVNIIIEKNDFPRRVEPIYRFFIYKKVFVNLGR